MGCVKLNINHKAYVFSCKSLAMLDDAKVLVFYNFLLPSAVSVADGVRHNHLLCQCLELNSSTPDNTPNE
jgi:hypothetical protein